MSAPVYSPKPIDTCPEPPVASGDRDVDARLAGGEVVVHPVRGSVAADRASWLLERLGIEGPGDPVPRPGSSVDIADAFVENGEATVQELRRQLADYRLVTVAEDAADRCTFVLQSGPLRRSTLTVIVEPDAPHRIRAANVLRTLPEGMHLRPALPEDGAELAELCRKTPILLGESELVIDPGDDYWTATRLMDAATALVAVYDGRIVAVQLGTVFEARFGGRHQLVAIVLHTRVHPDFALAGIRTVIQRTMQTASAQRMQRSQAEAGVSEPASGIGTDRSSAPAAPLALTGISYVSSDNVTTQSVRIRAASWKCKPYRVVLPCPMPSAVGGGAGRAATPGDASLIVELINACHDGEELFLPYTEEYLERRLARAPDLYSWDDVLLGDGAVVGTWMAGQRRRWTRGDDTSTSVRGLVVDYGFLPGREDELLRLLAATSAKAGTLGMTHLSIFTSDASPGSAALRAAASDIERYDVVNPFHPEPEGTVDRGMWVDQIHF